MKEFKYFTDFRIRLLSKKLERRPLTMKLYQFAKVLKNDMVKISWGGYTNLKEKTINNMTKIRTNTYG